LVTAEPAAQRAYYNVTQAAELLGVSRVSIWRWMRDGRLEASRLGHRTIRIERAALERILAENGSGAGAHDCEHVVQFFESDAFLIDRVSDFVGSSLRHGGAGVVIATGEHLAGIEAGLRASGLDLDAAAASQRYVALDAAETLAGLMIDGAPHRQRFHRSVGRLVAEAGAGGRRVRAFGEMVALLAADGQYDATIRLEELWNELQRSHSFSLMCGYPMRDLGGEALGDLLDRVCACHSRVTPAESYAALETDGERARAVAVLQQKAESLEAALAAERAARAAAEEALRLRDEFLQIAAHELRTPVTSLRGYAQLLLRRLVARFEAGKLAIETAPTDLAALVTQAVDAARGWSDHHTLTLESCDRLVADVDAIRLEQVLANLLENAVKYSPAGGPVQVTLRAADSTSAEIAVRDSGLGLPAGQRDRIFERFHQAHHNAHLSGMGLGLHISRQIVELHGGEIWAEAPAGGGARFVVRVPLSRG
jgi:excisionase family DNA binding protein